MLKDIFDNGQGKVSVYVHEQCSDARLSFEVEMGVC